MLEWSSSKRPDFIQLELIYKDVFRMSDCQQLLRSLEEAQHGIFGARDVSLDSDIALFQNIYTDVE